MRINTFYITTNERKYNISQAYLKLGNTQKAKELLHKTITLDSDGDIGKSAKEMLLRITN